LNGRTTACPRACRTPRCTTRRRWSCCGGPSLDHITAPGITSPASPRSTPGKHRRTAHPRSQPACRVRPARAAGPMSGQYGWARQPRCQRHRHTRVRRSRGACQQPCLILACPPCPAAHDPARASDRRIRNLKLDTSPPRRPDLSRETPAHRAVPSQPSPGQHRCVPRASQSPRERRTGTSGATSKRPSRPQWPQIIGVRLALNANDDAQLLIVAASVSFQACE
jgi:hypothetical protein